MTENYIYCDKKGCKIDECHFHCEELDFYGNPCTHIYYDYIKEYDGNGSLLRTYNVEQYHKHCKLCDETDEYHSHKPCYVKGCTDIFAHRHCKICVDKGLVECERGNFHCLICTDVNEHYHCHRCKKAVHNRWQRCQCEANHV